jgi:integrase
MKLTASSVAALTLPEGKTDFIFWDDSLPGFGVRTRGNSKHYIIQYRVSSRRQHRQSLGDIRKVTLDAARTIARTHFAQIQLGSDPAAEKAKARAASAVRALTLNDAAERYLDYKKDRLSRSSFNGAQRAFYKHFAPLLNWPLADIDRKQIASQLQTIIKEYGRTAAARARSTLSSLFAWAAKEGLVDQNPVALTNDPLSGVDTSRDRILNDVELGKVWATCGDDDFGRAIRLLLLTGCRRDEIGSLRWSEIDLDAGTLTISAERSKNRKAHSLILPAMALDILRAIPRRENRDYVFGRSGQGFQRWGAYTTALRGRLGDMPEWRIHDLRRTFRSGLSRLGVAPHIAELAINHQRRSLEATYDRYRYEREVAHALALWADHVLAAVENRAHKIVPLRSA